jgi:PKD repeat protein
MNRTFTPKFAGFLAILCMWSLHSLGQLTVSISSVRPTCYNDFDAKIIVRPSGVAGPYTISLISGFVGFGPSGRVVTANGEYTFDNLSSGGYSIIVAAQNSNCLPVFEYVEIADPPFYFRYYDISDSSCAPCDSRINFVVEPVDSFTYVWSNGATTPQITRVCDGEYSVTATHIATGCRITESITSRGAEAGNYIEGDNFLCMAVPSSFRLGQYISDEGECQNFDEEDISWDFGDSQGTMGSAQVEHAYQNSGEYQITVSHVQRGILAIQTVYVQEPIVSIFEEAVCDSVRTRAFRLDYNCVPNISGQTPLWNFDDPASGSANTSEEFQVNHKFSAPGQYMVRVSYGGYTDSLQLTVTEFANQSGGFDVVQTDCVNPLQRAFASSMPCQGNALWNFGDPASGNANTSSSLTPVHTFSAAGNYTVTLRYATAGQDTVEKQQIVSVQLPPSLPRDGNKVLALGDSVTIGGAAQSGFTYIWTTGETTTPITVKSPGRYILAAFRENDFVNCPFTDTVIVTYCGIEVSNREKLSGLTSLLVWPNPSQTKQVTFNSEPGAAFEVLNMSGNRMLTGTCQESTTELSATNWPGGLYVLLLRKADGNTLKTKFMLE